MGARDRAHAAPRAAFSPSLSSHRAEPRLGAAGVVQLQCRGCVQGENRVSYKTERKSRACGVLVGDGRYAGEVLQLGEGSPVTLPCCMCTS